MSVVWVTSNSKYEISSKDHLLQLMSGGTLFADTGTHPSDYLSSDYIQTADIDLAADSRITPIGSSTESFSGSYDGSNFSITDWTYENTSEDNVGLFAHISSALIQNVSIEGSWVLSGGSQCGFLVGAVGSSSGIYNITADLSAGSVTSSGINTGGLVGAASSSVLEGLTMKGVLSSISGTANVGGVVGSISSGSNLNYVRNVVRFTEDSGFVAISGTSCAGICSLVSDSNSTYVMGGMIGSVEGVEHAGGIFGTIENTSANSINHVVNSMTGSISSTGVSSSSGGIASSIMGDSSVFTVNTAANYMTGSITGTRDSGGIAGSIADGVVIDNSVIAMNGVVAYAGVQTVTGSNNTIEVQVITSFGLSHISSGTTVALTALTGSFGLHAGFPDLEYFAYEFSDTLSNNYVWEFVFGNVSGSSSYSQYTHVAISSSDVCGPIEVQVNLPDNSVEYVYLLNTNTNQVVMGLGGNGISITYSSGVVLDTSGSTLYPVPSLLITTTSPFSVNLSWEEVSGSVSHQVKYGLTSSGSLDKSVTIDSGSTSVDITNLNASSEYAFQVYSSADGTVFTLDEDVTGSILMPANSSPGYILSRFLDDDVYDFSSFGPDKTSQIASIIGNLLGQDESVLMNVNGQVKELLVAGVTGGNIEVTDGDQYILPFQAADGSGQSLTLEGVYEGPLDYNETNDSLTIDGQEYFAGDSVVVGNTRISLRSV